MRRRKGRQHRLFLQRFIQMETDDGEFMPRQLADWREIPSEVLERKEIRTAVQNAVDSLPEKYRQVFVLRDMQHLSVEETASVLGLTAPTVKTQLHRAR